MRPIQTDVSEATLITAIRHNMCDLFRHQSRSDPAEHFENDRFTRWYSTLSHPWFNGVLSSTPFEEQDEAFITATIRYFQTKQAKTFTWWLEPPLQPSDWEAVLTQHGFRFTNDTPGMAIDLQSVPESAGAVSGLEIRVVTDAASLQTWTNTFVLGYGLPTAWANDIYALWLKLGLELPMRNYIGYLHEKPVCASTLFLGGGAAGVYCVATVPEMRGQGLGAAITVRPLIDAQQLGYRIGVLQSSAMGFNIYKKLGFQHLCQIQNFYFSF